MNIKIEDYLSEEEIKGIITEEIKKHVKQCVGDISVSSDAGRVFVGKLAKELAKEGVQEIIPDFKDLINQQIKSEISKIDLSQMFWESYGWKSTGNKVLVEVLNNNKEELNAKIKEILKKSF
jgi:isopropylmalate/homocitrate/citramalate synthase